jgi:hypothetical protein
LPDLLKWILVALVGQNFMSNQNRIIGFMVAGGDSLGCTLKISAGKREKNRGY